MSALARIDDGLKTINRVVVSCMERNLSKPKWYWITLSLLQSVICSFLFGLLFETVTFEDWRIAVLRGIPLGFLFGCFLQAFSLHYSRIALDGLEKGKVTLNDYFSPSASLIKLLKVFAASLIAMILSELFLSFGFPCSDIQGLWIVIVVCTLIIVTGIFATPVSLNFFLRSK